jgi:hypothetical protein
MSSIKLRWSKLLSCLFCMMFLCGLAMAQSVTGTVSGTVVDASGKVIAGANVTLTNEQTASARVGVTNEEGDFTFAALQPGVYKIKIEHAGFRSYQRTSNILSANEVLALGKLTLEVGNLTEVVTTVAAGATVETESSDLTGRLTSDQIALISTKGRDITSLLRLVPGTSYIDDIESVGEGFGTDLPNISGQRGRSTVATVDGLNGSEPSGSNKLSMSINQDAVAEVKILRNNYAAEYGNNGGAIINLVSKSGKQNYAGSAYYFLRNEALNANPFFTNKANLPSPLYRHNIWGFNFGGPVQIPKLFPNKERKKLFFFYSYEKPHTITPQDVRFVTMPTALERQGDFSQSVNSTNAKVFVRDPLITAGNCNATDQSACFRDPSRATASNPTGLNIIPQSRFNSSGLAFLNFFPLPNRAGTQLNYVIQKSVDVPKQSQVIRFDYKPTEKDSFYTKLQWWTSDNEGLQTSGWPGGTPPDANTWGISSHYLYKDNGVSVNWVRIFSPTVVNEATVGARHGSEGFIPSDGEIDRLSRTTLDYTAPQLFPANNTLGTIPRVTNWSGVAGRPANINWLDRWGEVGNDYILPSFADNLSISRGDHSFKFGVYYERVRNGEAPGGNWSGTFNFSGNDSNFTAALGNTGYAYANALIGDFRQYSETTSRPFTNLAINMVQWYAQDQWKVNRRLTVNYGLRLSYHEQWRQIDGKASNFVPELYDRAKAPLMYVSACAVPFTPPATCPSSSRRAMNPATGQLFALTGANAGLVGAFVPGTGDPNNGLVLQSDPNAPNGFKKAQPIDLEPRVGFAWDISGSGKTVLRAMGGVYHSPRAGGGTTGGNLVGNAPFQRTLNIDFGNINNLVNLTGTALNRPSTVNAVESDSNTPAIYNFSFGIQQDIGFKTVMEVTYVGSLARHLGERRNLNGIPDGAKYPGVNIDPVTGSRFGDDFLRPYRGYGDINTTTYSGSSSYNGLQVQVSRRYTRGFQYGVAYTYSKTMDYAKDDDTGDVFYSRPYKAFNYGPADFDQTHIFTVNYIWDVPGLGRRFNNGFVKTVFDGWLLSGTTSAVSGKPKTGLGTSNVTYSGGTVTATGLPAITDYTGGEVQARPFVICDPNHNTGAVDSTGTPVLIDASCFARPTALGQIGNVQRNMVRLPGLLTFDLALFKNFSLGEKRSFQFRWETYNLFNHTNFKDIDGNMTFDANGNQTNRTFGVPTSARPPRVMQGSLRINF